jgi:hypothetical protein
MKNFNLQKIHTRHPYTSQEIKDLLDCCIGAVRLWKKKGLLPLNPGSTPLWFLGQDLFNFLDAKRKKRQRKCQPDEQFCFKCGEPRKSLPEALQIIKTDIRQGNKGKYKLIKKGICEVCGRPMSRLGVYEKAGVVEYGLGIRNAV